MLGMQAVLHQQVDVSVKFGSSRTGSWKGQEGINKLNEEVTQMPVSPTPALLFSLSSHLCFHLECPVSNWLWIKKFQLHFQVILHDMQASLGSGHLRHIFSLWNRLEGHWKGYPPSGKNFKQCTWWLILCGRRNGQEYRFTLIHRLWLMVWQDAQGLGRNMFGRLVTGMSGKRICGLTSLNEHRMQRYVCPLWVFTKWLKH